MTPHRWLWIGPGDLRIEREQCRDEGRDLAPFEGRFDELIAAMEAVPDGYDPRLNERAGRLLDRTVRARMRKAYPFDEPSAWPAIRARRGPAVDLPPDAPTGDALLDRIHGAWTGRCCGCLLGKPVEGRRRAQIETVLKSQGRWPLDDYWSGRIDDAVRKAASFPAWLTPDNPMHVDNLDHMPEDDDTNYTAAGLGIVKRHGAGFTPSQVGEFWASNIPLLHTCTAERVAYRNFALGRPAVDAAGRCAERFSTATWRNPYREWIGAQIRADFYGYVCPGRPARAAELAWRDAAFSHVKNGLYGEMWVAAMLAAAFVCDDVETVIRAGLAQVPARSRFTRDIEEVFAWRRAGKTCGQAADAVHAKWDEANGHHWCHTNSNAQIVAMALLWGGKDFGKTIAAAVMPGFDTDCNGATAGSVLGLILGRAALPERWTRPLRDTLHTGVAGYLVVTLADLARETAALIEKTRAGGEG
jgi:hypothetical protein